jgi:hypothetical protein
MLDNLKLITYDQRIINRLAKTQGFEQYQHRNNNYAGFCKYGKLMRLDFRKSFENGIFAGHHHLEISISPHYHFNNYLHNGNDFTPENCIKTVPDILTYLGIKPQEYEDLKVVNIEFGLNIIPKINIKNLINNLLFYRKTKFIIPKDKTPFFKITNATKQKLIKAYAKGLQFAEFSQYGIDINTFRFEVKSKKSLNIEKYSIDKVADLLKIETYQRLEQEIINEWQNILIINKTPDYTTLKPDEVQFVKDTNKVEFWDNLKQEINRNKFTRYKEKYYKILQGKNNLHTQIKGQIIDKFFSWSTGAYLPQKTPINKGKYQNANEYPKEINGKSAPPHQNIRLCLVTKLDISMQRKGSEFLCFAGLKYYKENESKIYKYLEEKYLSEKMKVRTMKEQVYYIAHNIRNTKTNIYNNAKNNRKRFEQRNYHPNQLQLF